MDNQVKKQILSGIIGEVVHHLMPTNILDTLEKLNENVEVPSTIDDLEEEKFIHELLLANRDTDSPQSFEEPIESIVEPLEISGSLTYYDIIEQEMFASLCVSKGNIQTLTNILRQHAGLDSIPVENFNLQTVDQFVNLAIYSMMTHETIDSIEQHFFMDNGIVERILRLFTKAVCSIKDRFIRWPTKREIDQFCLQFEHLNEFGCFEFYNVFAAIGTIDICIRPPLENFLKVQDPKNITKLHTPVKLQCSCNATGSFQSCFVSFPKRESDTKNSSVFDANPITDKLETIKSNETYIVGDKTLSLCPYLMTPHDKIVPHSESHNKALESKRKIIDKTFEKICTRFPILMRIGLRDNEEISHLIESICILHNFFSMKRDQGYLQ